MSEKLLEQAVVIRDETVNEANTAARIGKLFVDIIQKMAKSLNADAVTFKGSATGMNMVFSGEGGDVLIPLPVVDTEVAGVITPEMIASIGDAIAAVEKANADAIAAEQTRAEAAEKTLEDGIGAIRGSSTMTAEGNTAALTLKLIIGKGTPITLSLPVHGEEEWNVPADTPALIDPWTFQELMGLFESIENETKARSEADESLNASVNSLLLHVAKLTMAITPSVVFRSSVDTTEIAVSASMTVATPTILTLYQATTELATADGVSSVSSAATLTPTANVQFSAKAIVGELEFEAKATLQVVDPVYAGAGAAYADIMLDENKQTVRTSAAGTYNVTVANDGDYVWLLVPRGFAAIKKATLSGFDFPLETPTVVYVGGTSALTGGSGIPYSCYRSSNQYAAGNLSIVIS